MLFVFYVDTGTMVTFDINLALESVGQLKEEIERTCEVPVEKQVLLVSGGECLESSSRVCSYSAGTDTNPIFLFNKASIERSTPPSPHIDYGSDADLKDEVEQSLSLLPSITTVVVRSQLAQQLCEFAKLQTKACENLVHDQHLQQQGWMAVIANLDDITSAFRTRSENFESSFKQHLDSRQQYLTILESFSNDVGTLSKIPVLPALMEKQEESSSNESPCDEDESSPTKSSRPFTLLQWISSKDSGSSLEGLAEQSRKGLDMFDQKILDGLKTEVKNVLEAASMSELREIKGLEERLYGLEQLRSDTKKLVQEQSDLAQAFVQNQARASNLGDASILPDLCSSHKRQLMVMLKNHHQLRDIRRRCVRAKVELSTNLYHRLKWVMFVESRISEMDAKLVMYHESIKRLRRQLEVLSQIHLAPNVYLTAVAEVVRRRTFSQAFLIWANDLACQLCAVHSEEVARRRNFQTQFEGHFLSSLFPGLEDSPPPFATQAPPLFDSDLPKLSMEDIEKLRGEVPDLALSLSVPDLSSVTQFFLNRSMTLKADQQPAASIEDRIVEAVSAAGLSSNLDPALLQPADSSQSVTANTTHPISSDRGFESETDTEEFEKVGQSPSDINKVENNLRDSLTTQLQSLNVAVDGAIAELKGDMGQLKQWVLCERTELECLFNQINEAWAETNNRLMLMESERQRLENREDELEKNVKALLERVELERSKVQDLECELEREKEAARVALDSLVQKQKVEKDALTSRYRLYSQSLDLQRSSLSQDKIERYDMAQGAEMMDRADHEELIDELRAKMLAEYSMQLKEERQKWERKAELEIAQLKLRSDADRQVLFNETVRRIAADKDRQLDEIRSRECSLLAELNKQKEIIARLAPTTTHSSTTEERVQVLSSSSPRSISPSSSVLIISDTVSSSGGSGGSRDVATSPEPSPRKTRMSREKLTKSTTSLIQEGKVSIDSCNVGDTVLVTWDESHSAYTVFQDSSDLYFLHPKCMQSLGLTGSDHRRSGRPQHCIGQVVRRQYCRAKKPDNRYHVANGSVFYRVLVKPLS